MKKDVFEELTVVKRSGQRVNFNPYKIAVAIKSAFDDVGSGYDEKNINRIYENVLKNIETNYVSRKTINVEDIQDIIENELKAKKYLDVYHEFSEYRQKRAESRQAFKLKQQHKFAIAMEKITDNNLLNSETYKPKEILETYGTTVIDEFVKSYVIDNKYLRMFEEGNIYINNLANASLGRVSHTNLIIENMLTKCYSIPKITNFLIVCKDEIDGEIHISKLAKLLSKNLLRKFKILLKEYLENYLNVTGFTNYINMNYICNIIDRLEDLNILEDLNKIALNEKVKDIFKEAYNDALIKLEKIIKEDCEYLFQTLNQTKKTYSFSIENSNKQLTKLIKDIILNIISKNNRFNYVSIIYKVNSLDDKNLNIIFELIKDGKNILIANDKTNNIKECFSNGIRIYKNINDNDYSNGRLVVSKTSINMARLGIIYQNANLKEFYKKLEEILDLVKNELLLMFEILGNKNKENYKYLFEDNILYDEKLESGGKIRKVIKNSNLLIGLVGLKECVELLEENSDKQYKLLEEIMTFINKKCKSYRDETKLNFYTFEPYDDNSSKYFMALDKAIYGIRKSITDKEKYDLVSEIKCIKEDYFKLGKTIQLFEGGNIIVKDIKDNFSYNKFKQLIENIIEYDIAIIKFIRSSA